MNNCCFQLDVAQERFVKTRRQQRDEGTVQTIVSEKHAEIKTHVRKRKSKNGKRTGGAEINLLITSVLGDPSNKSTNTSFCATMTAAGTNQSISKFQIFKRI